MPNIVMQWEVTWVKMSQKMLGYDTQLVRISGWSN
jgi:hypothetical protein